jgi:RNA polymerase sigma-70 factor (ECF subfamily)
MPRLHPSAPDDEELACRAQQGCTASFEELVRRYQVSVVQFLRRLGAGADAEDLFQETCVRAYRNLHRYRTKWRFTTWLFTIARRVTINHHHRTKAVSDGERLESVPSRTPGPFQAAAEHDERRRFWDEAARILSRDEMTAIWLFYVQDVSTREIAEVLEISVRTVEVHRFNLMRRLNVRNVAQLLRRALQLGLLAKTFGAK